jgi:hypothetical protein
MNTSKKINIKQTNGLTRQAMHELSIIQFRCDLRQYYCHLNNRNALTGPARHCLFNWFGLDSCRLHSHSENPTIPLFKQFFKMVVEVNKYVCQIVRFVPQIFLLFRNVGFWKYAWLTVPSQNVVWRWPVILVKTERSVTFWNVTFLWLNRKVGHSVHLYLTN